MKKILLVLTGISLGIQAQNTFPTDNNLGIRSNKYLGWEYTGIDSEISHKITGGGLNPMNFTVNPFSANDPIFKFNGYSGTNVTILNGGNVGIGTSLPDKLLTIKANHFLGWKYTEDSSSGSHHTISGGGTNPMNFTVNPFSANDPIFKFNGHSGTNVTILNGGNVGIGTTNPDSKLTVAGNIHSREVKVTATAGGADFVFENDYNLPSLNTVESYIKENKHLPEIASAKEMDENGLNLAEMNIKLLQKIEELTLYTIQQQKQINTLIKQMQELKK